MKAGPQNPRTLGGRRIGAFAGVLACTLGVTGFAAGAGAAPTSPSVELPRLPAAETWSDGGIDPTLESEHGSVRVRVSLTAQPLLKAAASPRFQALVEPTDSPAADEASYEQAIASLDDESAAAASDVDELEAAIERSGGEVLEREVLPAAVIARVPVRRLDAIFGLPGVQAIDRAPIEKPLSDVSVPQVGAPTWWSAGFTGGTGPNDIDPPGDAGGVDVAVQSEAPVLDHPAFAGVTIDNSPAESPGDHGTHTAGIIASQDATYRGAAYGIDRIIGADNDAYALGLDTSSATGAIDPAEVLTRSFGGSGAEDSDDGPDVVTDVYGITKVESAGNSNTTGAPTIENLGRNMLSVGAFNDVNTVTSTDDVVLGISSRGPTPAGRKKPDLTAPGGSIVSPDAQWNTPPANPDFEGVTGTSFSAPHVAGGAALLEASGMTSPIAQRALLINSARDWSGTNTGLAGWTSGTQDGWRPEVGWGQLDLTTAFAQRANTVLGDVAEGEAAFYRATVPAGAKTTMAFELRGFFAGFPNPGTQTITYTQSNLELRQYTATGIEISPPAAFDPPNTTIDPGPNAIDPNDTVEQVRTAAAQTITFKVEAASEIDGAATEDFALASAAPLSELAAPVSRPTGSALAPAATVACAQPVVVTTQLVNDSPDLGSTSSAVGLELPVGVELVSGAQAQTVSGGTLEAGTTSEQKSWTVRATTDGAHVLTIAGAGEGLGTPFRRTQTVTLTSDCIAPETTTVDAGPGPATKDPTPDFSFFASGGATSFECSIDGGAFSACSSPFTVAPLADGSHTFAVRGRDAVGNVDGSPATRSFEVDTQPPDTSIGSGPIGPTTDSSPTFGLSASGGGSGFECAIDGGAFGACSSPATIGPLSQGSHSFAARAIDGAGNADPTPATRSFAVDSLLSGAKLGGNGRQRFVDELAIEVKASLAEAGRVRVRAKIRGAKGKTKAVRGSFASAGSKRLTLRASASTNRAIATALRGGTASVAIKARFTDALGNRATKERTIKLR